MRASARSLPTVACCYVHPSARSISQAARNCWCATHAARMRGTAGRSCLRAWRACSPHRFTACSPMHALSKEGKQGAVPCMHAREEGKLECTYRLRYSYCLVATTPPTTTMNEFAACAATAAGRQAGGRVFGVRNPRCTTQPRAGTRSCVCRSLRGASEVLLGSPASCHMVLPSPLCTACARGAAATGKQAGERPWSRLPSMSLVVCWRCWRPRCCYCWGCAGRPVAVPLGHSSSSAAPPLAMLHSGLGTSSQDRSLTNMNKI